MQMHCVCVHILNKLGTNYEEMREDPVGQIINRPSAQLSAKEIKYTTSQHALGLLLLQDSLNESGIS